MYKIFKSYYLFEKEELQTNLIQVVDCDLSCTDVFMYKGYYKSDNNKNTDVFTNSINYKASKISDEIALSYEELFNLVNLLTQDRGEVSILRSANKLELIDKLYKALLFYDDYINYNFSKSYV